MSASISGVLPSAAVAAGHHSTRNGDAYWAGEQVSKRHVPTTIRLEAYIKTRSHILPDLFAPLSLGVCAGTGITGSDLVSVQKLPKATHIRIHDFGATGAGPTDESALSGQVSGLDTSRTPEQMDAGGMPGADIAAEPVKQITAKGESAARAPAGINPQLKHFTSRQRYFFHRETVHWHAHHGEVSQ